jgi:hypothetical protein
MCQCSGQKVNAEQPISAVIYITASYVIIRYVHMLSPLVIKFLRWPVLFIALYFSLWHGFHCHVLCFLLLFLPVSLHLLIKETCLDSYVI